MKKHSFVYGALILFLASFINRIVGFAYQIVVIRLVKPEGVGLFNMVYPVYVLVLVISSMGIPVAISKLVAEEVARNNIRNAYRIFYTCLAFLVISGATFTALLIISAPLLTEYYFPNPKVYYSFIALAPGIFICTVCSAFRGFFQGLQQMTPTALTQTLEQLIRVAAGLLIAYLLLPRGVEYAAIGISLGVICGELTGLVSILFIYLRSKPLPPPKGAGLEAKRSIFKRTFSLSIPVTLTRFVSSALMTVDATLIPHRLQAGGMTLQEATAAYGKLVGISQTLLGTPSIITIALCTALIPAVSEAMAQNNIKLVQSRTSEAIRLTGMAGIPCIILFLFMPGELCGMLFGYPEAGQSLAIMALGGLFLYYYQTTNGILQGMGEAMKPFKNLIIASAFKIIGIYYLTAVPKLNLNGTAAAFAVFYIIMACLNLADLKRLIGFRIYFVRNVFKPVFAGLIMGLSIRFAKTNLFNNIESLALSTLLIIVFSFSVYFLALLVTGAFTAQDKARLIKFLQKILPK